MPMDRESRREKKQLDTQEEIKTAAWNYISQHGATSLSLRAVASSLGLSAPALYRYFPSKNHLVLALIHDAFLSLRDALDASLIPIPQASWDDQLRCLGHAYRDWAIAQSESFFLIFGDPVPGYLGPPDELLPVAGQSLRVLIEVIRKAAVVGALRLPLEPAPNQHLQISLKAWSDAIHKTDPDILYLAFIIATRVQGLMLAELGRQLPPFFPDGSGLFERELERIILDIRG